MSHGLLQPRGLKSPNFLLNALDDIPDICHLHHLHVGGEKICHVEKFQNSIKKAQKCVCGEKMTNIRYAGWYRIRKNPQVVGAGSERGSNTPSEWLCGPGGILRPLLVELQGYVGKIMQKRTSHWWWPRCHILLLMPTKQVSLLSFFLDDPHMIFQYLPFLEKNL